MARKYPILIVCLAVSAGSGLGTASAAGSQPSLTGVSRQGGAPRISGNTDGRYAWTTAVYRDLLVRKIAARAERKVSIDLRYQRDAVTVAIQAGIVSVTRSGRTVAVTSPESLQEVQRLLGGSDAVFALRSLLSERESVSDLRAPEMSLLVSAAFIASLAGDVDAPRRLATRFVEKHRGIFRVVREEEGCWDKYSKETTEAWNTLQDCMDEANQDESILNGAYRRLACNTIWLLEAESAWFEYLNCLSPLSISK